MAMISLFSATQPSSLTYATIKVSKLIIPDSCKYATRVLQKINVEQNPVFGEVTKKLIKNSCHNRRIHTLAASTLPVLQTVNNSSTYLFRTERGGHVKVITGLKDDKYKVHVEVSSFQDNEMIMSWGIFRSDSSSLILLEDSRIFETPFVKKSSNTLSTELEFDTRLAPFYVSFLLKFYSDGENGENFEIRSHRNTNFCFPVGLKPGNPTPLGLSYPSNGVINFAIFSRTAKSVILCLFDDKSKEKPALEIDLDPYVNRSGDIWHASVDNIMKFVSYGYRIKNGSQDQDNQVLLDPYSKVIGENFLGEISRQPTFDWSDDVHPCLPMEKLMVYRLNVTDFTEDPSSGLPNKTRGTISGVFEKLDHFKNLGVNAILLEPISPYDEKLGPYFPTHFFPMSYMKEIKEMVKKFHANGIEIFLEVVITHTSHTASLTKIDKSTYYHGTKITLNSAHPVVQNLVIESLRNWVIEYHIDGFCFVNSSSMLRGFNGENLSRPPLIEAISFDPILSNTKLISDSFDPIQNSTKFIKFPHWKRWAEINPRFFTDTRNFLRGETLISNLATRLCGSGDIFLNGRGPGFSFNFISRNRGFSLVDSVSFSSGPELSWNCGEEGATKRKSVLETRLKQIRNYLFILYISLGVPVLNMGDECGRSLGGSVKETDRKLLNWKSLETGFAIQTVKFISFLSALKIRRSDLLQSREFLKVENIDWYGANLAPPNWEDPTSKFLAVNLKVEKVTGDDENRLNGGGDMFAAFNGGDEVVVATVPPPPVGMVWVRLVDTSLPFPGFFSMAGDPVPKKVSGFSRTGSAYEMAPHSCVLLEGRRVDG